MTRRPRRSSRRSARPTRCSTTPSSARSTTRSGPWARARASPPGGQAPAASRRLQPMFGQGRGAAPQSPRTSTTSSRCSTAAGRRVRLRPVRSDHRRIPRLRRTAARGRRHGAHDDRLRHRDQGRDDHPAGRRRQAVQGEDPRRRRPTGRRSGCAAAAGRRPTAARAATSWCTVAVRPHPVFTRDGLNLRVTVPVTFTEAALGATIEVPDARRRPGQAARRPRHPVGARAAGQGPRRADGEGHRRSARRGAGRGAAHLDDAAREALERFHELEPKENPRADLMAKARRLTHLGPRSRMPENRTRRR